MWGSHLETHDQPSKSVSCPSVFHMIAIPVTEWEVLSYYGLANNLLRKYVTSPRKSPPQRHRAAVKATLAKAFQWQ